MDTGLFIAARYLFAKKSHNVINIISAISAAGMALGTAALILILSVCNGFDHIIESNLSDLDPAFTLVKEDGGAFVPSSETVAQLSECEGVAYIRACVEQNVLVSYSDKQTLARIKGVEESYASTSPLRNHIVSGELSLSKGDMPQGCAGAGIARELGMNPKFLEKMTLLYPDKGNGMPLLGAMGSLGSVRIGLSGIFSINAGIDNSLIVVPLEEARRLCGMADGEVTQLEITLDAAATRGLEKRLGAIASQEGYTLLSREDLHPEIYRMIRFEKLSIYIILLFVVIIIAFNIFGSMSMLIIEKRGDMQTLRAMGAKDGMIRRIFVLEGWMVSLLGLVCGLVAGICLALVQQHLGIVKMPGAFFINAYPCILLFSDILWTAGGVALVGLCVSLLAARGRG